MNKFIISTIFILLVSIFAFRFGLFDNLDSLNQSVENTNPAVQVGLNDTLFYQVKKEFLPYVNKLIAYNRFNNPADHVKYVDLWINPFSIDDIEIVFDQANQQVQININEVDGKIDAKVEEIGIETSVGADLTTNFAMQIKVFEKSGMPQISVPYANLPINSHTLHFHGTITEAILKLVLNAFDSKIQKQINENVLEQQVPEAVNKQLNQINTTVILSPNLDVFFYTTADPTITDHEILIPVGANLIQYGKSSPVVCEPISFSSSDMWQQTVQAYVGDCVFDAALLAFADDGQLNYTFPLIKHVTPLLYSINMSIGVLELPQLIMMNDFEIGGGLEQLHVTGEVLEEGTFTADVNLTLSTNLSAYIQGYNVIFQSVQLAVSNLSAVFYGCLTPEKCDAIQKLFTPELINSLLFIAQTYVNTYFSGHPFQIPQQQIGSYFDVELPYLQFKEHFMEVGATPVAK